MILFSLRLALNCETSDCKSTKLRCPCNFRLSRLSLISPLENNNLKKKIQASRSAAGLLPLPESMVLAVVLQGNSFHLGTPVCYEPGQFLSTVLCLFVLWG